MSCSLDSEDESNSNFQLGGGRDDVALKSVLGASWDMKSDKFLFDLSEFAAKSAKIACTERNILKVSSSICDPLGLISPITIQAKIIFQPLCKEKLNWDSEIPQMLW